MMKFLFFLLILSNLIFGNDFSYKLLGRSSIYGCNPFNYSFRFERAGDFNGDGYLDIVSKSDIFNGFLDSIRIIYGGNGRFPEEVSICNFSGRMTMFIGVNNWSHLVQIKVGDFNADGIDDIGISNIWPTYHTHSPETYIIYGSPDLPETIRMDEIPSNLKVTKIIQSWNPYAPLYNVSAADINNDKYNDLLFSEYAKEDLEMTGKIYIVYGSASGFPSFINVSNPPENIKVISGPDPFYHFGNFKLSDMNGDNLIDLIVSIKWIDGYDVGKRIIIIYYNNGIGFPDEIDPNNLPENSTIIYDATEKDSHFFDPFLLEDIDNDSYKDIIIGAPNADNLEGSIYAGKIYILYGTLSGFPKIIDLLYPPQESTIIYGAEEYDAYGSQVEIGDINNDGYLDIISSNTAWNEWRGKIWLLYGNGKKFPKVVDLSNPPEGLFSIEGYEKGDMVGNLLKICDLDKDGLNDFIFNSCTHKSYTGYANYCEFNIFYHSILKLK